ncbi:MAG: hypothetical protein Q4C65_05760 [Eubacteriales bacterium]|nr:hypothetical protein [Eubacteriales bacterium]
MKRQDYWESFLHTGRVEDYLNYRQEEPENRQAKRGALQHESASLSAAWREGGGRDSTGDSVRDRGRREDAGTSAGFGDRFEGGADRGV